MANEPGEKFDTLDENVGLGMNPDSGAEPEPPPDAEAGFLAELVAELTSPINLILLVICVVLAYRILRLHRGDSSGGGGDGDADAKNATPRLPKMKRKDFTVEELKEFDGVKNPDGRILVAVNGKVLDVTRGRKLYGPGAPYSCYAGHDASRGLATFSLGSAPEDYDDLSDLKPSEMESLREWEAQLSEKYDYVGRFLKPGEKPNEYSDDEDSKRDDSPNKSSASVEHDTSKES